MIVQVTLLTCISLVASAVTSNAQLPVEVVGTADFAGELELALRPRAITELLAENSVSLTGFPCSDGTHVDLELVRLDSSRPGLGICVDGVRAWGLCEGLELSVWYGRVAGDEDSEVALSFSQFGVTGWVRAGTRLDHLVTNCEGRIKLFSEAQRLAAGGNSGPFCASDALNSITASPAQSSTSAAPSSGNRSLYECAIAVETDWQLFQVFGGNLQAQAAYVTSLLTWASYRFEQQIGTVLTYPYVQFYTTANDPWHSQDIGGNCVDLLYEFQAAWAGSLPAGADLGHFLSGANLGCGAAFIGGLCDPLQHFGVTGNIDGNTQFPIQVGPSTFNFFGLCHELGHNFNAIHTHDYCPPLDQCAPPGYFGPCQTQKVCTSQGTLMSYCHGCPGGMWNITTYFHSRSAADMRAFVEGGCLPLYCADPAAYCTAKTNSLGCIPAIDWGGHPTLSGIDDFFVTASNVLNNKPGLLLRSMTPGAAPFAGGTLCLQPQILRTLAQGSGGTPAPAVDCSGSYLHHFSHAYMSALGLTPGTPVHVQFWSRDQGFPAPNNAGLTNALGFVISQ